MRQRASTYSFFLLRSRLKLIGWSFNLNPSPPLFFFLSSASIPPPSALRSQETGYGHTGGLGFSPLLGSMHCRSPEKSPSLLTAHSTHTHTRGSKPNQETTAR